MKTIKDVLKWLRELWQGIRNLLVSDAGHEPRPDEEEQD